MHWLNFRAEYWPLAAALVLLLTACTAAEQPVQAAQPVQPTGVVDVAPTVTAAVPTAVDVAPPTDPGEQSVIKPVPTSERESMVPLPPSENLVDRSDLFENDGSVIDAAALDHPLAAHLPAEAELELLFGERWHMHEARVVESDEVGDGSCDFDPLTVIEADGIDVGFENEAGAGLDIALRRGAGAMLLFADLDTWSACGSDRLRNEAVATTMFPDAAGELIGTVTIDVSDYFGLPESPIGAEITEFYVSYATVLVGDVLVSVSLESLDPDELDLTRQRLVDMVSSIFAGLA